MLAVRPLTKDGKWHHKMEKEYLCVRDSKEQGFTAAEFKSAQSEGWKKQYQYKVGKKNVYMPPSQAETKAMSASIIEVTPSAVWMSNPLSMRE